MIRPRLPRRRTVIVLGCFLAPPAVLAVVGTVQTLREMRRFHARAAVEQAHAAARTVDAALLIAMPLTVLATRLPLPGVPRTEAA